MSVTAIGLFVWGKSSPETIWSVVWNVILLNVHSVGNGKSSQLTNSFFQRGRDQPPFLHVLFTIKSMFFFPVSFAIKIHWNLRWSCQGSIERIAKVWRRRGCLWTVNSDELLVALNKRYRKMVIYSTKRWFKQEKYGDFIESIADVRSPSWNIIGNP